MSYILTTSWVCFGCPHRTGPDQETQDAFTMLIQQANTNKCPASRNINTALALTRAVTEVNYLFLETKAHISATIIGVWSSCEEPSERVCLPTNAIPSRFFIDIT